MKRIFTLLAATLLLTAALCVTASASEFDKTAEELSAIGMFRGSDKGFELDRAPTRSEAAIMLVRLYGAEESAKAAYDAGELTHPFKDVSDFAAPYVAWVYDNGISKGTGADTFGSANACSAKMYCAFLLRALGYQDGTDFAYDDTLAFAAEKGFYVPAAFGGDFLRDDLAAVTYQALATDLKDGSTYLLDSLVKSGAVDVKAAAPITEKIETYRALTSTVGKTMENSLDVDMDIKMDMAIAETITEDGKTTTEKQNVASTVTGKVQMILGEKDMQMGMNMKTVTKGDGTEEAVGQTVETGMWLKDGWAYVQSGDTAYKYQVEDVMALYQQAMAQTAQVSDVSMLPYIDSITAKKSGGDTVYTLDLSGVMNGMMGDVQTMLGALAMTQDLGLDMSLDITDCTYTYTVGSSGQLKNTSGAVKMTMAMNMDAGDKGALAMTCDYDIALTMKVNATGKAVKVSYPDLSKFQEIAPDAIPTLPVSPAA